MMPSEYCRKHVYHGITGTPSSIARRHEIGLDRLMWGADFPHHEGTVPYTRLVMRGTLAPVPEDELRQFFSGTAADLYGADMALLQSVADRVGPTVDEIAAAAAGRRDARGSELRDARRGVRRSEQHCPREKVELPS